MKKLNIFDSFSPYFPYRWFVMIVLVVAGWLVYYDVTGRRVFQFSNQQQWSSNGPGYHK